MLTAEAISNAAHHREIILLERAIINATSIPENGTPGINYFLTAGYT